MLVELEESLTLEFVLRRLKPVFRPDDGRLLKDGWFIWELKGWRKWLYQTDSCQISLAG